MNRYIIGEKIFAYEVGFKFKETYNGITQHLACKSVMGFIDENGDGKFETMTFQVESVPDWAVNGLDPIPTIKK